jgi:putative MATE family efflux protein
MDKTATAARETAAKPTKAENQENQYLGKEKISKLLFKFSIPCILALLITSLYNIVDQIFIGHGTTEGLGAVGNAATSIVFPLTLVAVAISGMFGDGTAAFLSICQGRKDTKNAHRAVGGSAVITFLISLILVALGFIFADQILGLFGASADNLLYAKQYFYIILSFFPIYMLGYMLNSVIRADGSPTFAMIATVAGAVTNIILDPIFIFVFNWGIQGAAWATITGQILTLVISIIYLARTKTFRLKLESFKPQKEVLGNIAKLGVSTFITQLSIVIISMVCNKMLAIFGAQSEYGANDPLAIIGICMKVFTIVLSIAMGIIIGAQPILGYNIGAGNNDRVRETFRKCILATIVVGAIATIIFEVCPEPIISIFGSNSENPELYMKFAALTFRIFLSLITFTCTIKVISIFFQAVGEPLKAAIVSLFRDIIIFCPLVLILPHLMNNINGILWAAPIADIVGIILSVSLVVVYFRHLGRNVKTDQSHEQLALQPSHPGVIITISREHGSQGKKIGELVAKQLGIPYYYKELTALAAAESGLDKEYIKKVSSNDGEQISQELYLTTSPAKYAIEAQDAVLKEIAKQGSCVIVGRAADYVLRDQKNLLRVFIYAPKEMRVKNIMSMYGDDEKSATKNIDRSDKNRADYYSLISGQKWGDPRNYDLCVDASLGKEKVAELICSLAQK